MRRPELLIPASSLEVLKTAVIYGADAVYIGGEAFGLRAKAKNFSMEEMKEGIEFAHAHDVKVYVTAKMCIRDRCPHEELTIIMRRYMMKLAEHFAKENKCLGLITGESIGQVASQTMHSLAVTTGLSVNAPLRQIPLNP